MDTKDLEMNIKDMDKDIHDMDKIKQRRQAEFLAWKEWLNSYEWQWFLLFTLLEYDCRPRAEDLLLKFTRQLCTQEGIHLGYAHIYCENQGVAHIHALMVGSNSTGEKTLSDVSRSKWNRRWPCISNIQIPDSNYAVSKYLALHLFKFKCSNYPVIEFYNKPLVE